MKNGLKELEIATDIVYTGFALLCKLALLMEISVHLYIPSVHLCSVSGSSCNVTLLVWYF